LTTSTTDDQVIDPNDLWDEMDRQAQEDFVPPAPAVVKEAPLDDSALIESWARDIILDHELNRPRSRQVAIGPSAAGAKCDRQIAMQIAGVQRVHFSDPLKAYVGTGLHLMMDDAVSLRDRDTGRYLTEHPVEYRGVAGSVDVFDRVTGRVMDWKSKDIAKIKRLRKSGRMSDEYRIQQNIYAAGLLAQGENVTSISLVYLPTNGDLADIYVQTEAVDLALADRAIDRLEAIRAALMDGKDAETFPKTTSALCGWCDFYNPKTPDSPRSCAGGIKFPVSD
jgi:hypothetical protein